MIISHQDVFSTFLPLNKFLNKIGLSCVYLLNGKLSLSPLFYKCIFSFLLLVLSSVAYSLCYYFKRNDAFIFIIHIFYLVEKFHYIVDIYFVNKFGKQNIIDYIGTYQFIDQCLKRTCYEDIKRNIRNISLFLILIAVLPHLLEMIYVSLAIDIQIMLLYFFEYVFYVLKTLSVVDMISHIIQVKFRLKTIGDILEDYCSHIDNVSFSETIKKSGNNIKDSEFLSYNYRHISLSLSRCYFLLTEQCNFINAMYGLRVSYLFMNCFVVVS